jgi:hypothetical protein
VASDPHDRLTTGLLTLLLELEQRDAPVAPV